MQSRQNKQTIYFYYDQMNLISISIKQQEADSVEVILQLNNKRAVINLMEAREKIIRYRRQIRKEEVETYRASQRYKMAQKFSLDQLSLRLTNNPSYSMQTLLEQFWGALIDPFRVGTGSNNLSIQLHITFWSQHLVSPRSSPIESTSLVKFILEFKERNSWNKIKQLKEYSQLIVEVIQNAVGDFQDKERKEVVEWLADIQVYSLLKRLMRATGEFPQPEEWPNLYQLIGKGLQSLVFHHQIAAAELFLEIVSNANSADNYTIFIKQPQFFKLLLDLLEFNVQNEASIYFWSPILWLLNTEQKPLLHYSRSGLVSLCGRLINSELEANIFGALNILLAFSLSEDPDILDMLTVDEEMQSSSMWLIVAMRKKIYCHEKSQIRSLFFKLCRNCLSKWEETQSFKDKLQGLLEGTRVVLEIYFDEETICPVLECFLCLLGWIRETGIGRSLVNGVIKLVSGLSVQHKGKIRQAILNVQQFWSSLDREMEVM